LSSADWTTFNGKTSNLGTVTSVGLSSATSGVTIGSSPVTTSGTITLTIATASGSQNGLLSSTDWSTFNGKQNSLTNPVTGTGTSGQVAYFTATSAISSESNLFWDSTNDRLGIGLDTPSARLTIKGNGVGSAIDWINTEPTTGRSYRWVSLTQGGFAIEDLSASPVAERLRVTTNGNIHIGTFSFDNGARLQVSGTANISGSIQAATESNIVGSSVNARILVTASGVANTVVGFNNSGSTTTGVTNNTAYLGVLQAYPLVFTTDSVERLRIASTGPATFSSPNQSQNAVFNSTGNVLITSNASPAVNNGGSLSFGGRYWTESNTIATFGRIHGKKENSIDGGTAGYLSFETTLDATAFLSEKMRITSLGNVGIGTASPSSLFTVAGTSDLAFSNATTLLRINRSGSQARIQNYDVGSVAPIALNWEGGNVLIGTTTDNGNLLRVNGAIFSSRYRFDDTGGGFVTLEMENSTRWRINYLARFAGYGAGVLTTDASGNITAASDSTLKNIIKPVTNVLENIMDFNPVYFKWNEKTDLDKENIYMSTIAQSIQKHYPEAIGKMSDGTLTVQDRALTAILVRAIQELKQEIDTLKN
jgi:hypothetical protein